MKRAAHPTSLHYLNDPTIYMTTELHATVELGGTPDPLTDRVRATWTAGDFGRIAKGYSLGAAEFIARLELEPDERVLDVACGTGNLALPAARIGASVTGIVRCHGWP